MTPDTGIERLLTIMARLRDPQWGCPWDLKQDFRSIAPYTLEESFEVVDAIERGDLDDLREELGDLLLQVVFHAQMAKEQDRFDFGEVVSGISDKMVRRHPHVFGEDAHADDEALHAAWDRHKHRERAAKRGGEHGSLMNGVAVALPALVRAEKLQRRAARVGFDWDRPEPVLDKIREELDECAQALSAPANGAALAEEVGDLLFSCVNLARHLRVDAEQALRGANRKFERRFRQVEQGLARDGLAPDPALRERMEALWEATKQDAEGIES
jgi:MazG family protein